MIMAIPSPGIYDMIKDQYHDDPCPTPSLSSGMINDLLIAPAKCFQNSKRLNPDWEPPEKQEKFSIGSVSHIMLLEPHTFNHCVVVVRGKTKDGKPSDGYSSQDAKDQRDEAIRAGKTPILPKQLDEIYRARDALFAHAFVRDAFKNGRLEQSIFWKHPIHGFWCRARPDFIADGMSHLNDYKATANASPQNFGRHAYNLGYYRRAAWYLEGIEAVTGIKPPHYWFCSQEIRAPYLTSVVELDHIALEAGRDENNLAAATFARCLGTGDWYGYRDPAHLDTDRAFRVGLPPWAYAQIDERLGRDARNWARQPPSPPDEWNFEGEE
jgi:PDDEXK-like domain of unknown function (DUF3799)